MFVQSASASCVLLLRLIRQVSDAEEEDEEDDKPKTKKIKKTINDWELINDAKVLGFKTRHI